jgi:ribosomal protein S26
MYTHVVHVHAVHAHNVHARAVHIHAVYAHRTHTRAVHVHTMQSMINVWIDNELSTAAILSQRLSCGLTATCLNYSIQVGILRHTIRLYIIERRGKPTAAEILKGTVSPHESDIVLKGLVWTWDAWYLKIFKVSLQFLIGTWSSYA